MGGAERGAAAVAAVGRAGAAPAAAVNGAPRLAVDEGEQTPGRQAAGAAGGRRRARAVIRDRPLPGAAEKTDREEQR